MCFYMCMYVCAVILFRVYFMRELAKFFADFSTLNNSERTGFVLGWESWDRYDFKALLSS